MARLRSANGHIFTLPPRRVSLGESAANDVPIAPGHGLAAVHFRLQPWESGHFLEDAGSGLGTLVNEKPVSWVPLKHGDTITAGELRLTYETEESSVTPAPPVQTVPVTVSEPDNSAPVPTPPEAPPSWLPPEALLPPVPPWAQTPPSPPAPSRKGPVLFLLFFVLLAGAGAAWYYYFRR